MEHYYRCHKCGKRTPSYENKFYLDEYCKSEQWEISDNKTLCHDCATGKSDNSITKLEVILWISIIIIILILIFV